MGRLSFWEDLPPLRRNFWLISTAVLAVYLTGAIVLTLTVTFPETGPAAFGQQALDSLDQSPRVSLIPPRQLSAGYCLEENEVQVILIETETEPLYAIYCIGSREEPYMGHLFNASTGEEILEPALYRKLGMWKYWAIVKSPLDWVFGFAALIAIALLGRLTLRQEARVAADLETSQRKALNDKADILLTIGYILLPFILIPVTFFKRAEYRLSSLRSLRWWLVAIFGSMLIAALAMGDVWGVWATIVITLYLLFTHFWQERQTDADLMAAFNVSRPPGQFSRSAESDIEPSGISSSQPSAMSSTSVVQNFNLLTPDRLPDFSDVGGMKTLKKELSDSVGLMLAFGDQAEAYSISWNGFLLHGPPGVGKSFFARATAGELGLNFIPAGPAELTSPYLGESARLVSQVFDFAHQNIPCLLFFDEFDSIAGERDQGISSERRLVVNELLRSLEAAREHRDLIVMAATNDLTHLDPAVIRPGRFDYHLHVDYPDQAARIAILEAQLEHLPRSPNLNLDEIARRLEGVSAADAAIIVRLAAMRVFRESVESGAVDEIPITQAALLAAVEERSGKDRPAIKRRTWDDLILPEDVKQELIELQYIIENPHAALSYGVKPPSGVILWGPPGTGKTTIARVLAWESQVSFYPISAAEILSMWYGESEQNIKKLFTRARRNRPSIIFIDEIDALLSERSGVSKPNDRTVNQFLQEIDGMSTLPGVIVVGATNRFDSLDPAALRGGRLSRHIYIPLPEKSERTALFRLMTKTMPLDQDVDLSLLADKTSGFSGADIEALCQKAALEAMMRSQRTKKDEQHRIIMNDFEFALEEYLEQRSINEQLNGD